MKIPEIKAKTIIQNKADKNHFWFGFDYNMNLYQGCHHGCIYCDSRSDCYQISNFDQIKVKHNVLTLLSKELCSKKRKGVIAIGAMSDPYNHWTTIKDNSSSFKNNKANQFWCNDND